MELGTEYQEFRKILCICPCCNRINRVSDIRIYTKESKAKTWLDEYETKLGKMIKSEDKFGEKEQELRKAAQEKGRKAAEKAVNKVISPEISALKLDPFDVKPILNPVDFIVFDGMTKKDAVEEIMLLSRQTPNSPLNDLRAQLNKVVKEKKYEWQIARITEEGEIQFE